MRILADPSSVLALALVSAGCGTYTTYQTAEPLGPGNWRGAAAIGAGAFADPPSDTRTPTVTVELGASRGVGEDTDVGAKLFAVGVEAHVKHRFHAARDSGWSLAVIGAAGGVRTNGKAGISEAVLGQLRTAVPFTRRTSPRWAFSFGPVATASLFLPAGGGDARGLLLGAFANAVWTRGCWHLLPELSLHRSIAGDVPVDGSVLQLGVGFARDL